MGLLKRAGSVATGVIQCPCEDWQIEFPVLTPVWMIKHELDKHFADCIVGAANRLTAKAASRNFVPDAEPGAPETW